MDRRHLTEAELVALAAAGDREAVAELLLVRYRVRLEATARSVNTRLDDDSLADLLQSFAERNLRPDSKGDWRLRGLAAENNPQAYVMASLRNYMRDEFRKVHIDIVDAPPEEGRTADRESEPADDDCSDIHPKTHLELQIEAVISALESLGDLSARERYILVTFLLGERYRGNGARPLKIRDEISRQLGENPSTVYNRYSDLKDFLRQRAAEYLRALREQG